MAMKFFSHFGVLFLKKNFQIVYAILLLILIPLAVVLNSLIFISSTQKVIDTELQRKATLAQGTFANSLSSETESILTLRKRVQEVGEISEEVYGLDILMPEGEDFRVVASLDPQAIGTTTSFLNNLIAWKTGQPIAYSTLSAARAPSLEGKVPDRGKVRYWVVTGVLSNEEGKHVGLVSMKISSQIIDDLSRQNLNRSIFILIATIIVVVLLLSNNTRLFEYAVLFRKLREVDQMKDEFISIASHELRAPITGIQGYLRMILKNELGPVEGTVRQKLSLVDDAAQRLHELVEDLLDVSRIEQRRLVVKEEDVDIVSSIQSVVQQLDASAQQKGLPISVEPAPRVPHVLGDAQKIRQVITNLVNNAIKYTFVGSIRITIGLREPQVEIKIIDTGLGMSAKDREHLFEKFYRIRTRKTADIPGTGLGLWITHELVRLMKGELYVDSIEGVGTQVSVLLRPSTLPPDQTTQ